jgi:hypothetical protein
MQLDEYRIAIRERAYVDILDLALQIVRAHLGPLVAALLVGVVPAMLLNAWLLQGWHDDYEGTELPVAYLIMMPVLVYWLAPLVTAPTTLLLGQLLFNKRMQPWLIAADFLKSLPQLIWYQVIVRGLLILMVATSIVPIAVWPYLNEVILLERNPFRGKRSPMTTQRRLGALHSGFGGDLFVRGMGAVLVAGVLTTSIWLSSWVTVQVLVGGEDLQEYFYTILYPLALWIVAGYFCVVRFLGYLDLRIRREGWEVELLMRAEGARLSRRLT